MAWITDGAGLTGPLRQQFSSIPVSRLVMNNQYSLHIPSTAIRNALGNNLYTDIELEFTTASGASIHIGEPQNISELPIYTKAEAIGKASDGVIITLSGQTNDNKQVYSILHITDQGNIVAKKVFDSTESLTFRSNKKLEVLSTGSFYLYNSNRLSFFDANLNKSWSIEFNTYACAFGLPDGSVGVFNKGADGKSTVYSQYSENGTVIYQKLVSNYPLCTISKTTHGYVVVCFLESVFNDHDYEFIKIDNDLNIISSKAKSFSDLPRTSGSNFIFPKTQDDDYLRIFRIWNKTNISIIKLDWEMNIVDEYQTTDLALNSSIKSVINEDGSLYMCYSIKTKATGTTNFTLKKVMANGITEWSRDVYLDPSSVMEAGFIINNDTVKVLATTFTPIYSFRFFNILGPNNYIAVSFNSMGGESIDAITALSGSIIPAPKVPTKPGYMFIKWYKDKACTNEWIFSTDKASEDTILYAKWQEQFYDVVFDPQGGNIQQQLTVGYNSLLNIPEQPMKDGYRFDGWFKEQACINKWNFDTDRVTSNITLYAKWIVTSLSCPSAMKAISQGYNSIKITWNAVVDASGYEIYRSTSATGRFSLIASITGKSYTNASITTGRTYFYKVRAYGYINGTKVFGGFSVTTSAKAAPAKPATGKASVLTYNSIKIVWSSVIGATRYELWRSTSAGGTYKRITTTSSKSYTNKSLATGTTYYYKVRAYRSVSGKKIYGAYSSVTSAVTKLGTPSSVKAVRMSATSIRITWSTVGGRTKYEIWRCETINGIYTIAGTTTTKSFTNKDLTLGTSYYYKVRAYRSVSGRKVYGVFTAAIKPPT